MCLLFVPSYNVTVRVRHAACGMRQRMPTTVGTHRSDSTWRTVLMEGSRVIYCHPGLKHAVAETTNISCRNCRRRRMYPHPAVVHELDNCGVDAPYSVLFNDVVNSPTVTSVSLSVCST